jgi:hypothetical protein
MFFSFSAFCHKLHISFFVLQVFFQSLYLFLFLSSFFIFVCLFPLFSSLLVRRSFITLQSASLGITSGNYRFSPAIYLLKHFYVIQNLLLKGNVKNHPQSAFPSGLFLILLINLDKVY